MTEEKECRIDELSTDSEPQLLRMSESAKLVKDDIPFHLQILENCAKYGDSPALTDEKGTISFSELRHSAACWATVLEQCGLVKGDSILVILPNCNEYAVVFLATSIIGATISGISTQLNINELQHYIEKAGATMMICDTKVYADFADFGFPILLVSDIKERIKDMGEIETFSDVDITVDEVLIEPFSSGTSGMPKCVQLTHGNFIAATNSLSEAIFSKLTENNRRSTLAVLPFYHGSGFWALLYCLLAGHHTIIMEEFHPIAMLKAIQDNKVDVINVVPSIISCLVKMPAADYDISSLNTVLCGSAPLGKELSAQFMEKFPDVQHLIQGYGMTELVCLSHITPLNPSDMSADHWGSCGKLLPGFEFKIVPEQHIRDDVDPDFGELCLRGPCLMKGYKNEKEHVQIIDKDGWMHTGDVVSRDEDGFFYVVDRKKDLIKVNGMQVAPAQLEDVLLRHEDIAAAAVVRVNHMQYGEVPRAFVVLRNGRNTTPNEISVFVKERVASFKQLRGGIFIVDELPMSASGKVLKRELYKLLDY